jgi:hypothetical protein
MAELRGRPLAYLSLALAAWVGGRIYWSQPGAANAQQRSPSHNRSRSKPITQYSLLPSCQNAERSEKRHRSPKTPVSHLPWTLGRTVAGLPVCLRLHGSRSQANP